MDDYAVAMPMYGGATTFAELDSWQRRASAVAVDVTMAQFDALLDNLHGVEAPERYAKAQALVEELADRIEKVRGNPTSH